MGDNKKTIECKIPVEFLRYVVVGGIAFGVDYSILVYLNLQMGLNYMIAAGIGFIGGLAVNYVLSVKWVFKYRSICSRNKEFALFSIIGIVGLLLNEIIILMFTGFHGVAIQISKIIATAVVFIWNYSARKILIFRETRSDFHEALEAERSK